MIHEFKTPLAVHTPHGEGEAIMMIDYGLNTNSVWVVRIKGGKVLNYYSDDIRLYGNPMNGNGWDIDIPKDWKKDVPELESHKITLNPDIPINFSNTTTMTHQFESNPDDNTNLYCKRCGLERWQHPIFTLT
jgi:hypothetical protein